MSSMTATNQSMQPVFTAGIDTHKNSHHVAVIDDGGAPVADHEFEAGAAGDTAVIEWLTTWHITHIGVEQTGTYGAGLTRALERVGYTVLEVNHPDTAVRARHGKSDPIDAFMAATAVWSGRASTTPKDRTGIVESIRLIHLTRSSAVRTRAQLLTQIQSLLITAPDSVRTPLGTSPTARQIIAAATRWRADRTRLADPVQAAKLALRALARRIGDLDTEIKDLDTALAELTATAAPKLLARPHVGPNTAAELLIAVGQQPGRLATDAQFARLAGIAPIPASSGQTHRMRLHRGGNRQANKAIHIVAIGRLGHHQPAIDYYQRRLTQGLSRKDAIRAMKRHIARELFGALKADLKALDKL